MAYADWLAARQRQAVATAWRGGESLTWTYAAGGTAALVAQVQRGRVERVDREDGEWQLRHAAVWSSSAGWTPIIGDTVVVDSLTYTCVEVVETGGGVTQARLVRTEAVKRHAREFVANEG